MQLSKPRRMTGRRDQVPRAAPPSERAANRLAGFTGGDVFRHLARLAAFMAMGSVAMNAAQIAEAAFLGMIGTEALAAMGFAFPVIITLFAFGGGIGVGASSVIARAMGAGQRERAAQLVSHAQALALAVGLVLSALGAFFANDVVTLLGARGVVREMTVEYLRVYMIGVPFFLLSVIGSMLLRAVGRAASPGVVMTVSSLLQIVLCPPLIFGWFGLPALGVAGAAWAYVLSRFAGVAVYAVLMARARMIRWTLRGWFQSCAAILHVGGPAIASGLIMPLSMLIVTRLLAGHGHEVVAGFNVASRVEMAAHMILWSASSSVEPFVGQNWGARRFDRVRLALRITDSFCLVWGALTFALLVVFGGWLATLIDDNPTVVTVAEAFFLVVPASIGFMGVMQVASSCFNARGKPLPAFVISLSRAFVFYVPLAILGNWLWGYMGIFIATAATNVLVGIGAWHWGRRSVRKDSLALMAEAH